MEHRLAGVFARLSATGPAASALAAALLIAAPPARAQEFITVASTTSTEQSGLFKHLLPEFRKATGIEARVVAVGTGQALDMGRRGDADVVFAHDKAAEEKFVAGGFGVRRLEVMYNDFIIVGPKADPAGARGKDVTAALKKIADRQAAFASRADKSGTHAAELRYWKAAGIDPPKGAWYRETGSGMGPTLNTASGMNAYALTDRGTWLSFKNRGDLAILVEGDVRLFNQYGVMLVNPSKHPHVKKDAGQKFVDWVVSPAGQAAIAAFRIEGEQLFFPNARKPGAQAGVVAIPAIMSPMIRIDIRPVWRFTIEGREKDFDFQLIALLEALHREPKLTAAAAHAGVSYRHAWNLIEQWQEFFGAPLVEMERGKGTRLTALGSNLLWAGQRARARLAPDLESLASEFAAALNAAFEGTAPPLVLHASHDYAVAGLREFLPPRGIVAEVQYRGSFESLAALVRGECDLAGFHLPEGPLGGPIAHRYLECLRGSRGADFHVIALARRTQGFIVRSGNPLGLAGIRDLARPDVRMINRQRGSGTRALLEALLSAEAIDRARLRGYDIEEATHAAVAALIAGGQADVGFGVQAAAAQYRLDFVPVCRERYYFACRAEAIARPRIEGLLGILRDAMYRDLVGRFAGYSAEEMGRTGLATEILARAEAEALG